MSDIDTFTDALVRAFDTRFDQRSEEGQRLFRSCYGPSIRAVARVALERVGAELDANYAAMPFAGQSADYVDGLGDGFRLAHLALDTLMPADQTAQTPVPPKPGSSS